MFETKVFELRDRMTFIVVIGVRITRESTREGWLLTRAGYGAEPLVLFTRADGDGTKAFCEPEGWQDRTFQSAHQYVIEHWNELRSGDLIDVEYILGESSKPKKSESLLEGGYNAL